MKQLIVFALVNALCISMAFAKKGVVIDVELTAGSFQAKTKKIKGKVQPADGGFTAKKLYVKVKHLETGIEMRDEHLHKRLVTDDANKVVVTNVVAKGGKGSGTINIKGIKKKFSFKYEDKGDNIEAKFKLNLKDFKITGISYMGIGVEDEVSITAEVPKGK
jgi:polyisoprenoid-binding protein YceI